MQKMLPCLALAGLVLISSSAAAKRACVFEGTLQGKPVKDCSEINRPVPEAEYQQQCELNEQTFKAMGAQIRAYVLPACPKPAKASCSGAMGSEGTVYYYLASDQELASKKTSCSKAGGKWQAGS